MTSAIEVKGLTKVYRTGRGQPLLRAVDGIDFAVRPGEVFGLLGPNGAGKTTAIRMLTGLARPTEGTARVLGLDLTRDIARIKKVIGVVPEASNLYAELSAFDNLMFSMQLYGVPRAERKTRAVALLERFGLGAKRGALFANLSRGMKRSLTIAAALAHRPRLLFLDEPTLGLDVMSARRLRELIAGLRDEGVTVFLTTHYMDEADQLCDRIAILVASRIVALDTVNGLRAAAGGVQPMMEVATAGADGKVERWRIAGAPDLGGALRAALAQAEAQGRHIVAVDMLRPTLEDAFVQLSGLGIEALHTEKAEQEARDVGG